MSKRTLIFTLLILSHLQAGELLEASTHKEIIIEEFRKFTQRHEKIEQKLLSTVLTIALAIIGWYLNSINTSIETMSKAIAENNIQYKELSVRFDGFEKVQVRIDNDYKEIALRIKALELKQERADEIIKRHDAMLNK